MNGLLRIIKSLPVENGNEFCFFQFTLENTDITINAKVNGSCSNIKYAFKLIAGNSWQLYYKNIKVESYFINMKQVEKFNKLYPAVSGSPEEIKLFIEKRIQFLRNKKEIQKHLLVFEPKNKTIKLMPENYLLFRHCKKHKQWKYDPEETVPMLFAQKLFTIFHEHYWLRDVSAEILIEKLTLLLKP